MYVQVEGIKLFNSKRLHVKYSHYRFNVVSRLFITRNYY